MTDARTQHRDEDHSQTTDLPSWGAVRDRIAARSKPNFIDQDPMAMGVEEESAHLWDENAAAPFTSPGREVYQQALETLGEHEHIELKYEDDSPWQDIPVAALVHNEFFEEQLSSVDGFFPDETLVNNGYADVVAEISFDLSNEFEKATGVNLSLVAAHHESELIDTLQLDSLPEGTSLYRLGHVPGFAGVVNGDFYDRDSFEEADPTDPELAPFMTQKRRYIDHLKSHGNTVMSIGGTDSIQVTMRPLMETEMGAEQDLFGENYRTDDMFREFFGAGQHTSMAALSPVLYAPFMNSPVFETTEDENGDTRRELVHHMGREWAYENGLGDSEYVDMDGTQKWGYIPELAEIEGVEDAVDVFADKIFQFSAGVEANSEYLTVKGTDKTLYEVAHGDHDQLDPDTEVNVRVGHEDYGTINFKDFVETGRFEGLISLPNPDSAEEEDELVVEVDYSALAAEDEDAFHEQMWGHFLAHSSGIWPSYRPRFDAGAVESRDYGNSPRLREAVDTQVAAFLKWDEIQAYADEHLDMWDGYADIVRDGIGEDGLEFVLPSGDTVKDAWYGLDGEDGLLDILAEGVREASYGREDVPAEKREEYAEAYRTAMEANLTDGTYSEVFARELEDAGLEAAMENTRMRTDGYGVPEAVENGFEPAPRNESY